jgi:hypothetical protein
MNQYKEGKWPPNVSTDEVDAGVMKFIGRTDFTSAKSSDATALATAGDYTEESIENNAHKVLFEYMQHFENQGGQNASAQSVYPTDGSNPYLPTEQDIILQVIPELAAGGTLETYLSGGLFGDIGHRNDLGLHSEPSNFMEQTNRSTNWPSSSLYDDPSLIPGSLYGHAPDMFSQPFLFDDILPPQGAVGHENEQMSQDQELEQLFLNIMP